MAHRPGTTINPYAVSFDYVETLDSYTTDHFYYELRCGSWQQSRWLWLRVTVRQGSNYLMSAGVSLETPVRNVRGLPYGSGDNWSVGSGRCSEAIAIWPRGKQRRVTFRSGNSGGPLAKSVFV